MLDANTMVRPGNGTWNIATAEAARSRRAGCSTRQRAVSQDQAWAPHLPLLPLLHGFGKLSPLSALIGVDGYQSPLVINFSAEHCWHMIVEGTRGSGKSSLLRSAAASMALSSRQSQLQYIGMDLTGRELVFLESIPHMLTELVRDVEFAEEILEWLVEEMNTRIRWRLKTPHLVVWVSDVEVLASQLSRRALRNLARLWGEGASAGIHIAASASSFSKLATIFRGLASSVHISLSGRQLESSRRRDDGRATGILRLERRKTRFQPVSFSAREMNTAAILFSAGFRMNGDSLYATGGADGC